MHGGSIPPAGSKKYYLCTMAQEEKYDSLIADLEAAEKREREAFEKMTPEEQKQYLEEQEDLLERMSII